MYKKTLLSLAVASSIALTGCVESGDDEVAVNPDATSATLPAGSVWPIFDPAGGNLPIPSDLNFDQEAGDGSFGVDGDMTNPVIGALNNLSGASTVAPAVIRFNGQIDPDTVDSRQFIPNPAFVDQTTTPTELPVIPNPEQTVFLIELEYASGAPVRALSASEPPTIPLAITFQVAAGMNPLGTGEDLSERDQGEAVTYLTNLASSPAYDHDVVELDGTSAIRIRPLKPLNPLTRYVAVVTDGVKKMDGETSVTQSPTYKYLTETTSDNPLVFKNTVPAALAPVGTLINRLWETLGTNYFGVTNASRAALTLPALDAENIALSYSFTTSGDKDVLKYIANPGSWVSDQLERSIAADAAKLRVDAAKVFTSNATGEPTGIDPTTYDLPETASDEDVKAAVVAALVALGKAEGTPVAPSDFLKPTNTDPTEFGFEDVKFYVDNTLVGFTPGDLDSRLAGCDGFTVDSMPTKFECVGSALSGLLTTGLAAQDLSLGRPGVLDDISINSTDDLAELTSAAAILEITKGNIDVHQGDITLPYYVAVPDATQTGPTSTIKTQSWRPNPAVAQTAGDVAGISIPQSDPDVSEVHNYNFPFPSKQDDVKVPMLVITPSGWNPTSADANGNPDDGVQKLIPVIYQHGITTDRSAALTFGSALVNAAANLPAERGGPINIALFAIDQPLHGVSPFDRGDQEGYAALLLEQLGVIGETDENDNGDVVFASETDEALANAVIDGTFNPAVIIPGLQDQLDAAAAENDVPLNNSLNVSDPTDPTQIANAIVGIENGTLPDLSGVTGYDISPQLQGLEAALRKNAQLGLEAAQALVTTVANSGSTIPGLAPQNKATGFVEGEINERHFGFTANDQANPIPMDFDEGIGSSGSLFINLSNFLVSRDTLKQGALDLMNLAATVDSLEGTAGMPVFIGHSLGTLNGGAFVGASTASGRKDILMGGAHLMTPVAGVTRLLENSPSFAPTILGGLAASPANLTQGDADLETFLNINQTTLDAVDPMNFANELAVSNVLLSQINGDRTTPNAAGPNLAFMVPEANPEPALDIMIGNLDINSFPAPLSGSEPLSAVMGASANPTGAVAGFAFPAITRYAEGVHSLPVLPVEVEAEEGDVLKDRTIAAGGETIVSSENAAATFSSLVAQTIALIGQVNSSNR